MNTYLDHYCERLTPGLWNEPFNTASNIAFIIVAFFIIRHLKKRTNTIKYPQWDLWLLSGLIVIIGIGSSIWHIFAVHWTLWADRIPILTFISIFFISCLVRVFKLNLVNSVVLFLLFQLTNAAILIQFTTRPFNGSIFYLPTLALLITLTALQWHKNRAVTKTYFLLASILFSTAILLRSVDIALCDNMPIGTHFIWHILVAFTIYPLMLGLINSSMNGSINDPIKGSIDSTCNEK